MLQSDLKLQEKSELAVTGNRLRRSRSASSLVPHSPDDQGLVQQPAAQQQDSQSPLLSLCDEHFAISEATLDQARSACEGNWIEVGNTEFRSAYGEFVEYTDETAFFDHEEPELQCCQDSFGPGLCKNQFVPVVKTRFDSLFADVVDILRAARDVRRRDGYVAHHPLLLFCLSDGDDDISIASCFLMARVSFNPFDATLLEFNMTGENRAVLATADDCVQLHRLSVLLFGLAQNNERYTVKTGPYKALSLSEIELDGSVLSPSIAGREAVMPVEDAESEDEGIKGVTLSRTRSAMMKALQGRKANQPVKKAVAKKAVASAGTKKRPRKSKKDDLNDSEDVVGDGNGEGEVGSQAIATAEQGETEADRVDNRILQDWGAALGEQLGPVPVQPPQAGSSSSSSSANPNPNPASSASASTPKIPIVSFTLPWRDEKGYCWDYNAEINKARFLGLSLRCAWTGMNK